MEKLLVIGAGIGQVPLIRKAQARGVYVVVASQAGNYPGFELADESLYCDIYDREKLLELARELEITAVISDQNDLMMPTVAYIAEHMGLPGNTFRQVQSFCNKNTFRNNCDRLGIPVPKHISVASGDFDLGTVPFPFPWMIKPADSQSSIGVCKVENAEEAAAALKDALEKSKTHQAIIEQFFVGKEVVCEGFIYKGKYYNLSFADRKYFKLDKLAIPSQTLFPSELNEEAKNKILDCEQKMASYICPSYGIVHAEWLINEKNEICSVESALRGGGVYISSHLIPLATHIDINDVLLDLALGRDVDVDAVFRAKKEKASAYVCFYLPEGTVTAVRGVEEVKALPFVAMSVVEQQVTLGEKTRKMTFKGQRLGPILVAADNRAELEANIETVKQTLQIEVTGPNGEKQGVIWA